MSANFNKKSKKMRKINKVFKFVKIDFSFLLLLLLAMFLEEIKLYFLYVVFICLHEISHLLVAKKLGYIPKQVHFTFFGASLEGYDDFLFLDEIKIVLAGPIFNFLVVIICYLCFWFNPESYIFLSDVLISNLSILMFNVMPIYPLDFGRLMLAIFSKNNTRVVALKKTKKLSFIFLLAMFFVFICSFFFSYNFSLGFVCVNLMRLLFSSARETSFKREYFVNRKLKLLNRGLVSKTIYVSENMQNYKLFKFIDDNHFYNFVFLNHNGEVTFSMSEIELYKKLQMLWCMTCTFNKYLLINTLTNLAESSKL